MVVAVKFFLPEREIVSLEGISGALDERERAQERSSIGADEHPCSVPSWPRPRDREGDLMAAVADRRW
ncbi:hypothetical protein NL676_022898 [Syzygium grande]|nr:hypothetical protein NL676_022898 [Syzygium grande]